MAIDDDKKDAKGHLRVLTEGEMRNGLDGAARRILALQAAEVLGQRCMRSADATLERFARRNQELAELRLGEGLPAYVKVEGVDGIVRQMPDGTRDLMEILDGVMTVAKRLPPAREGGSDDVGSNMTAPGTCLLP